MSDTNQVLDPQNPSGPVKVHNMTVRVDRDLCIGAAPCVAIAMNTFTLDDEAKAIVLQTANQEEKETIIEAAKACPVAAIIVEDDKGNQIFP